MSGEIKFTYWITELTKGVSNSLSHEHLHHLVSAAPSSPCGPESSIQIDCRSEGSLMQDNRVPRRVWEILSQRKSSSRHGDTIR